MRRKTKIKILILLAAVAAMVLGFFYAPQIASYTSETVEIERVDHAEEAKNERINEIKTSPEFIDWINSEAERRYYEEMRDDALNNLQQIEGTVEHSREKAAAVLRRHLEPHNPELAAHADHIVTLPRWIEAVGIMAKETKYCTKGVGASKNNCGGIKNSKTGNFKVYNNDLEAVEDITILLAKPSYANRTIAQMNGLYCQDASQPGRKCKDWDNHVLAVVSVIEAELRS